MMAINLSKLGQGDYWDDVDRYVRNQFTEMQMKSGEWIDHIAENYPTTPVGPGEDGDQVSERVVGSFSGWASANDYCANQEENIISGCCTGNGARAIFYVWENMLEFNNETLSIHLLLNRASPWADVNSYVPYEGQIDVVMKTACNVEIRIPEWVKPEEVSCFVNNIPRETVFRGRYAQVGSVESGNVVTMVFPDLRTHRRDNYRQVFPIHSLSRAMMLSRLIRPVNGIRFTKENTIEKRCVG